MIVVFCYKATRWENGQPSEKDEHHIGFTDVVPNCGLTIGEIRIDEMSGKWCFYPMAIAPSTGLSHANLKTVADKLCRLNADSLPIKKSSSSWKGRQDLGWKQRAEIEKSQETSCPTPRD